MLPIGNMSKSSHRYRKRLTFCQLCGETLEFATFSRHSSLVFRVRIVWLPNGAAGFLQMMRARVVISTIVLALAGSSALAFEETTPEAGLEKHQSASPAKRAIVKPSLNLNGTGTSVDVPPRASGGTEVRIPGLGKLGVMPKLDFGLELLYGGREQTPLEADRNRAESDDVHIRGSIRHRF